MCHLLTKYVFSVVPGALYWAEKWSDKTNQKHLAGSAKLYCFIGFVLRQEKSGPAMAGSAWPRAMPMDSKMGIEMYNYRKYIVLYLNLKNLDIQWGVNLLID